MDCSEALLLSIAAFSLAFLEFLEFLEAVIFLLFCLFEWFWKFGWSYLDFAASSEHSSLTKCIARWVTF